MTKIPAHLLNSKLITDKEWEEYQDLKHKIKMYEDPDDLTLFYMWLDVNAKDKLRKMETEILVLKERNQMISDIATIEKTKNKDAITYIRSCYIPELEGNNIALNASEVKKLLEILK